LTTERNSTVKKAEILKVLDELNHYQPKEEDIDERQRKQSGRLTKSEIMDDAISVRHKELITEK
jgi:hypothetical protein